MPDKDQYLETVAETEAEIRLILCDPDLDGKTNDFRFTTLADFCRDNPGEENADTRSQARSLHNGESFYVGGGAAPWIKIGRLDLKPMGKNSYRVTWEIDVVEGAPRVSFAMRLPGSYVSLVWVYLTLGGREEGGWWRTHCEVEEQFWIPPGVAWLARIAGRHYATRRNREEGNREYTSAASQGEWQIYVSSEPREDHHDEAGYS